MSAPAGIVAQPCCGKPAVDKCALCGAGPTVQLVVPYQTDTLECGDCGHVVEGVCSCEPEQMAS